MYKVLIIDDESIIVEGLMRVVPWHSYHCKVIGTAFDGKEGTLAIRKHCPDIVITDIRMPGIDGLSMISGIKSEFPNMQIMILTGFRDFAYAQEAIKLGVTRFLLKPSKLSEIDEALKAMTLNLSSRQKDAEPGAGEDTTQDTIEAASSFIVRHAIEYMEEHYAGKISLSEVAAKCYVSQWHLSKLLNKHARQNFYEILNNIRIREAKKLLSNPMLRICEISEMVGYTDAAHFSRVFKKLENIPANEYRNLYSNIDSEEDEK